jgi:hypothetical protein
MAPRFAPVTVRWRVAVDDGVDALAGLRDAASASAILWTLADYPRGHRFYRSAGWTPDGRTRDSGCQISYRHRLTPADELSKI